MHFDASQNAPRGSIFQNISHDAKCLILPVGLDAHVRIMNHSASERFCRLELYTQKWTRRDFVATDISANSITSICCGFVVGYNSLYNKI